jgi:hypothetical protein
MLPLDEFDALYSVPPLCTWWRLQREKGRGGTPLHRRLPLPRGGAALVCVKNLRGAMAGVSTAAAGWACAWLGFFRGEPAFDPGI